MSELYDNLLRATDNTNDITNEKYATVTKIEGKFVSVKEENSELEHSNVPVLNNVKLELGDKVVIGFVDNSIYNPILIGSLEHNSSSGDDVSWEEIVNKPSTFTPSAHNHNYEDISNAPIVPTKTSDLTNDSGFLTEHQSLTNYIQKSQISGLVKNDGTIDTTPYLSSLPIHNHDDRYYTESEIDDLLNDKLDVEDAFSGSYNDLTNVPSTFTPSNHNHSISDINNLQSSLNSKLETTDVGEAALTNDYEDLDNLPTLFDGNYNSLSNKPSTFTPSEHNHSDLDIRTYYALPNLGLPDDTKQSTVNLAIDTAIANHNHSDLDIRTNSALPNLGLLDDEKQTNVNLAIDRAIGYLSSIKAIEVVSTKPTASSSTMGKLYIISENNKVNVYYTEESNGSYSWHEMDADILDDLSMDWSDIENKPSIPTKTSDLTNDGDGTNAFLTQHQSLSNYVQKSNTSGLLKNDGTVDTTQYLSSLPSHNHDDRYYTESEVDTALGGKQATLVSGTNIKTINNQSILGSGNISVQGGGTGVDISTSWSDTTSDSKVPSEKLTKDSLDGKEDLSNKVTSISPSSTDTQYPSAKCVYDNLNSVYDNFIFNENLTPYTHILSNYTNTSTATLSVANAILTITGNGASNGDTGLLNTKVFAPKDEDYIISFDIRKATGTYVGKDFNILIGDSNHYLNISPQYYVIRFGENGTEFDTIDAISCTSATKISIQRTNGNNWKFYVDDVLKHSFTTNSSEIPNQITFYGFHNNDVVEVSNVKITRKRIDSSKELVDMIYPVGSIYMSVNNVSPQYLFGGTWERLKDRFLLGSGDTYNNGATGGSATVSLTESEMPRHTHIQNSHNHTQNAHHHTQYSYYSTGTGSSGAYVQSTNRKTTRVNTDDTTATNIANTATNKYTGGTGTSESASNGSAHENMPPYLAVYMWKRTA